MKKYLIITMIITFGVLLMACGDKDDSNEDDPDQANNSDETKSERLSFDDSEEVNDNSEDETDANKKDTDETDNKKSEKQNEDEQANSTKSDDGEEKTDETAQNGEEEDETNDYASVVKQLFSSMTEGNEDKLEKVVKPSLVNQFKRDMNDFDVNYEVKNIQKSGLEDGVQNFNVSVLSTSLDDDQDLEDSEIEYQFGVDTSNEQVAYFEIVDHRTVD